MIHCIKDRGHIHEKLGKNTPEILDVPEKNKKRREDQPYTNVEDDETADRVDQKDKTPGKGDMIQNAKGEKNTQRQTKIDETLDVLGQQEKILRYIDLGENMRVACERTHAL